MAKTTKETTAAEAQAQVNDLSQRSARLHQQIGETDKALAAARDQQALGTATAADDVARLVQKRAHLVEEQDQVDHQLVEAVAARDRAAAREALSSARKQAEKAPRLRELADARQQAAERVEAAVRELADAVAAADEAAWNLRREGGQQATGDAVERMMQPRALQGALWSVMVGRQPLGRRIGCEKPHKPRPFAEYEQGARNRLMTGIARLEARPAELEAQASGKTREAA